MTLHDLMLVANGTFGPRFMDGVVLLGIAAAVVTVVGTMLLAAYAIIAGVMRRWHR